MKLILFIFILASTYSYAQEDTILMEEDSMPVSQSYQMSDPEMPPEDESVINAFNDPDREYTYEEIPEMVYEQ